MTKGWLVRGLESARMEADRWPDSRREALARDQEFQLNPVRPEQLSDEREQEVAYSADASRE
jgi:hypothetical protein